MKGRKLYLGLIFILSVAVVYLLEAVAQDKGIALGNVVITAKDRPSEWQDIIASDASENQLRLIVDGVEVAFAKNRIYMENNLDIMIPTYIFRNSFKCAFNTVSDDGIELQKGNTVVSIDSYDTFIDVNGKKVFLENAMKRDDDGYYINAHVLEINISCPNVKEGGIAFGQRAESAMEITSAVKKVSKKPIIMKLSPNVTDITEMAKAVEAGGADAVSLINTLTGMKIDINRRTFAVANKTGGLSGPAIKPVAVRMVYQVANAVNIPIIGMGGIASAEDALEFIMAGATMVAVGTANFNDPMTTIKVIEGIQSFMEKNGIKDIAEITGCVK